MYQFLYLLHRYIYFHYLLLRTPYLLLIQLHQLSEHLLCLFPLVLNIHILLHPYYYGLFCPFSLSQHSFTQIHMNFVGFIELMLYILPCFLTNNISIHTNLLTTTGGCPSCWSRPGGLCSFCQEMVQMVNYWYPCYNNYKVVNHWCYYCNYSQFVGSAICPSFK